MNKSKAEKNVFTFHAVFRVDVYDVKPQLHCHDFGHDGATTHPDLSSRDASA